MITNERELLEGKVALRDIAKMFNLSRGKLTGLFQMTGSPPTFIWRRIIYTDRTAGIEWVARHRNRQAVKQRPSIA